MNTKRFVVGALLCSLLASGVSAREPSTEVTMDPSRPLTRAEVVADLRLWQRAGLGRFDSPYLQDVFAEAYQQALQRYFKLRNGPDFLEEVLRVASDAD